MCKQRQGWRVCAKIKLKKCPTEQEAQTAKPNKTEAASTRTHTLTENTSLFAYGDEEHFTEMRARIKSGIGKKWRKILKSYVKLTASGLDNKYFQ